MTLTIAFKAPKMEPAVTPRCASRAQRIHLGITSFRAARARIEACQKSKVTTQHFRILFTKVLIQEETQVPQRLLSMTRNHPISKKDEHSTPPTPLVSFGNLNQTLGFQPHHLLLATLLHHHSDSCNEVCCLLTSSCCTEAVMEENVIYII